MDICALILAEERQRVNGRERSRSGSRIYPGPVLLGKEGDMIVHGKGEMVLDEVGTRYAHIIGIPVHPQHMKKKKAKGQPLAIILATKP